jgi:FMN phosphatase YigB (HAD superfamily)
MFNDCTTRFIGFWYTAVQDTVHNAVQLTETYVRIRYYHDYCASLVLPACTHATPLHLRVCMAQPHAWKLTPGAVGALERLRRGGVKVAVVSNFDTRLRPLLHAMGVAPLFDAICVSAEVSRRS